MYTTPANYQLRSSLIETNLTDLIQLSEMVPKPKSSAIELTKLAFELLEAVCSTEEASKPLLLILKTCSLSQRSHIRKIVLIKSRR